MSEENRVSFNPDNVSGGAFIDDIVVKFTNCRTEVTDYEGRAKTAVPAFVADLMDPEDDSVEALIGYWKAGDATAWGVDDNGFVSIGKSEQLNEKAKFIQFVISCVNSGFDADKIENDVSVFEGMIAHVITIEETYKDLKDEETGKDVKSQIIIVDRIDELPYKTKKKKAGGKKDTKKAADKSKTGASDDADTIVSATQFVMDALSVAKEKGDDGIPKKELSKLAFTSKEISGDLQKEIIKLTYSDEFLDDEDRPWNYEDGILSMG